MALADKRAALLNRQLKEEAVSIPAWADLNLFIRELSAKAGSDLIAQCTDDNGKVVQDNLIAGIILATLRDAEDPNKALLFGMDGEDKPNPAFRDSLMATGLSEIMAAAKQSIALSGLDEQAAVSEAKNA